MAINKEALLEQQLSRALERIEVLRSQLDDVREAARDYLTFQPSDQGMPHIGSEAWEVSRARLRVLIGG